MTPIGGKSVTETSIDTNNNHVSLYGQVICRLLNLTAYYYSGHAVFALIYMEEQQEMVRRQFNSFKELELTFRLNQLCEKHHIAS